MSALAQAAGPETRNTPAVVRFLNSPLYDSTIWTVVREYIGGSQEITELLSTTAATLASGPNHEGRSSLTDFTVSLLTRPTEEIQAIANMYGAPHLNDALNRLDRRALGIQSGPCFILLVNAVEENDRDMVQRLLSPPHPQLSPIARSQLMEKAARNGNTAILEDLFHNGPFVPEFLHNRLFSAFHLYRHMHITPEIQALISQWLPGYPRVPFAAPAIPVAAPSSVAKIIAVAAVIMAVITGYLLAP